MTAINLALNSIINGKNDFCCLCLSSLKDESIKVNDIVVVSIDNNESEIAVLDVLSVVFDEKVCKNIILTFQVPLLLAFVLTYTCIILRDTL